MPDETQPTEITLPSGSSLKEWADPLTESWRRELYAKHIAQWIVILAAVSILSVLAGGYWIIYRSMGNPENAKVLIKEAVIPLLEKAATFFTTVYSPLLAFILGYYFGQRQAQRRRTD